MHNILHLRALGMRTSLRNRKLTCQFGNKSQTIKDRRCRVSGTKFSTKLAREMANRNCQEQRSVRVEYVLLTFSLSFVSVSPFFISFFFLSLASLLFLSLPSSLSSPLVSSLFFIHLFNFPLSHTFSLPSSLLSRLLYSVAGVYRSCRLYKQTRGTSAVFSISQTTCTGCVTSR